VAGRRTPLDRIDYRPGGRWRVWAVSVLLWLLAVPPLVFAIILLFLSDLRDGVRVPAGWLCVLVALGLIAFGAWRVRQARGEPRLTVTPEGIGVDDASVAAWSDVEDVAAWWTDRANGRLAGWLALGGEDAQRVRFGRAGTRQASDDLQKLLAHVVQALAERENESDGRRVGPVAYGPDQFSVTVADGRMVEVPSGDVSACKHTLAVMAEENAVSFWLRRPGHDLQVINGTVVVDMGSHDRIHTLRFQDSQAAVHLAHLEQLLGLNFGHPALPAK